MLTLKGMTGQNGSHLQLFLIQLVTTSVKRLIVILTQTVHCLMFLSPVTTDRFQVLQMLQMVLFSLRRMEGSRLLQMGLTISKQIIFWKLVQQVCTISF